MVEISEIVWYNLFDKMARKTSTQKNLNLLLSGKHPQTKKYEGKHVMVVKDKVVPLKEGKESIEQFKNLEEKHGEAPTLVFVPRTDISYIL